MNNIENLQRGDLVVFNWGSYGCPVVFHSFGFNRKKDIVSVRGFSLRYRHYITNIKEGRTTLDKIFKDRVQGYFQQRVWKITEDCLTDEERKNYYEWKQLLGVQ